MKEMTKFDEAIYILIVDLISRKKQFGANNVNLDAYVHVQVPLAWSQQRVRVLVMPMEDKNE